MADDDLAAEVDRLRRERDLYLRVLELSAQDELEPFLGEALALAVEVAGAHQGYLELHDEEEDRSGRRWWIAHGFSPDQIESVRETLSQGIIAQALATGRTIETPSALLDPRFRERGSVRTSRIEAVLCAPIAVDAPLGVLYLQRREQPGAFPSENRAMVEAFARHLAPVADRLLAAQRRHDAEDPTAPVRQTLHLDGIIGRSPVFAACLKHIALVAPLEVSVLLTGETGTGKTQLARVLHNNSSRSHGPFVELNCGTVPETLVESELFGAFAGAHSTATRRIEGRLGPAQHGTLLLDEIGDLSPNAQARLLQLLQSRIYYPLGSARPMEADFRIIAATNIDIQQAVRERRFREDLLYRLQVLPIRVPSLAERRDDIPELAQFFCAGASERNHLPRFTLSRGALRALEAAEWPGNIRQLGHAVEAGVIVAHGEGSLQVERRHLFAENGGGGADVRLTFQDATRRFQAKLLRETLEESGWNVVEASRRLDLARAHIYNLMRAYGIERPRKE